MGYTIYWSEDTKDKIFSQEFLDDVNYVIDRARDHGIIINAGLGVGYPEINSAKISINGSQARHLDSETFTLGNRKGFAFCKTEGKPYTFAVAKILHMAKIHGYVTNIEHDGTDEQLKYLIESWPGE